MKYLLFIFLSCNTYQGIIISNDEFTQTSEARINESHYIVVNGYYEKGDTIIIDKTTLNVLR
jgi:hypothetical protein